jgi:hypothetical protein
MSLTLEEIKEKLLRFYDPDDLLEALQISSEEILDRFEDKLIKRLDSFYEELEEEEEEYAEEQW